MSVCAEQTAGFAPSRVTRAKEDTVRNEWDDFLAGIRLIRPPVRFGLKRRGLVKGIKDLYEEWIMGEMLLYSEIAFKITTRKIASDLLRIYWDDPKVKDPTQSRYTLVEYKRNARGKWIPRIDRLASLSEKRQEGETFLESLLRGLKEELGIVLSIEGLAALVQLISIPDPRDFGPSDSLPGLMTDNTLEFASLVLPQKFYKPYYLEWKKKKGERELVSVFLWVRISRDKRKASYPKVEHVVPKKLLAS